ncbi:MAG: hypothetical protein ACRDZY_21915 [Acidimicrobiales bacterium]
MPVLLAVRSGNAALVVATVDRRIEATGLWRRRPDLVFAHSADIEKTTRLPRVGPRTRRHRSRQ